MDRSTLHRQMAGHGEELRGVRLLVVEDDYLVASDLCASLRRRGAAILGPAGNMRRGRELVRQQRPDYALLDINLNGNLAFDLAAELRDNGIRTIFTTGYDTAFLPVQFKDAPCLQKPVNLAALVKLISSDGSAARVE
jgi:ActR/RegA family two-component response regulator